MQGNALTYVVLQQGLQKMAGKQRASMSAFIASYKLHGMKKYLITLKTTIKMMEVIKKMVMMTLTAAAAERSLNMADNRT